MPVSILAMSSGAAIAVSVVKGSIGSVGERAHVCQSAGDRCGCGHGRAHDVRERAGTLPPLEIAVRRRRRTRTARDRVAIGAAAHRAARVAPFETGFEKDAVEAFGFG